MDEPKRDDEHSDEPEDLAVPEGESDDVKGGALNSYFSKVQGEKQGQFNGSVTQK